MTTGTVAKAFRGKIPLTSLLITPEGREALAAYRRSLLDALGAKRFP